MAVRATNKIRIMLDQEIALGPGKADLLEAIQETGSISGAARRLGMSYKRAWDLVDTMNRCFNEPLVSGTAGGRGGGGARVTGLGLKVLQRYRAMERKAAASISRDVDALLRLMRSS